MNQKKITTKQKQAAPESSLLDRVVLILEQARTNVVRAVNSSMVTAYWLIGREIVQELQGGDERAEYGKQVIENLSSKLNAKYGKGFSVANLKNFRQFYATYSDRLEKKSYPLGSQLPLPPEISYPMGSVLIDQQNIHPTGGELIVAAQIGRPASDESAPCFNPHLSWSHYRALMRVVKPDARDFYERETIECGWSKAQLERQIHTSYYERILKNKGHDGLLTTNRERLSGEILAPIHLLKSPYILEFLDLPDGPSLHEKDLEKAIISNLQSFLLELGKGFSFVARQKHIRFEEADFYVDLVFYNFMLKCFVLIDLKIGKLTHQDVGQMDGYVRLYDDRFKVPGDNPTIGLILCSDKSETVAKYSVLNDRKQIFASKYMEFLPTEQELAIELERERKLIEAYLAEKEDGL
jgi:predicted nuclease of restriction endonuclease-like (RecB) superfamily